MSVERKNALSIVEAPAHSKLGASSYKRWKNCPGSVRLCEGIVSESSIYAEEGTKAHDFAARQLLGEFYPDMEEEMREAVDVYLDHIKSLRDQKPTFEEVEQRLDLSEYHPALFGTADYVCYFAETKTLHVVDYKHGRGVPVEVDRSEQLMYYGLGALHKNKVPIARIVLTIVQPRCYHPKGPIRSWETDAVDMVEFSFQLVDDALATEKPDALVKSGSHCQFCPAQPTCPAMQAQALAVTQGAFTNVETYDPDKLAYALSIIPQVKSWCEAVHKFAHSQAELGNVPPGWKLVDKRANRKWAPGTNAFALSQTFEKDESKFFDPEPAMLSPAQVEKMLTKDQKILLDQYVIKESSGKTLVPCTDDRAPVKGAIESMFNAE